MTGELEKKIGQMLVLGFRGTEVGEEDAIARDIRDCNLGGVILFELDVSLQDPVRNVRSPEQVRALTASLSGFAETPLFIAIDQEGGKVARLNERNGFERGRSARELGDLDDPAETRREAAVRARMLADNGINLNCAPDIDLNLNPQNPIIGGKDRSYSADPMLVAKHAREVVRAHRELGIGCTPKHFPGHGSSVADTHLGFVDVTETWREEELTPFAELIGSGDCDAVMTAHVFHGGLDPDFPAPLSRKILHGLLRERLEFRGLVFSDDMEMGAISSRFGLETALLRAVEAGVDVLTFANNALYQPEVGRRAIRILADFVRQGIISESRIDESCQRIADFKNNLRA